MPSYTKCVFKWNFSLYSNEQLNCDTAIKCIFCFFARHHRLQEYCFCMYIAFFITLCVFLIIYCFLLYFVCHVDIMMFYCFCRFTIFLWNLFIIRTFCRLFLPRCQLFDTFCCGKRLLWCMDIRCVSQFPRLSLCTFFCYSSLCDCFVTCTWCSGIMAQVCHAVSYQVFVLGLWCLHQNTQQTWMSAD